MKIHNGYHSQMKINHDYLKRINLKILIILIIFSIYELYYISFMADHLINRHLMGINQGNINEEINSGRIWWWALIHIVNILILWCKIYWWIICWYWCIRSICCFKYSLFISKKMERNCCIAKSYKIKTIFTRKTKLSSS